MQAVVDFAGRYIYHDNHERTEYNRIVMTVLENVVTVSPRLSKNELAHTLRQYKDKIITELQLRLKINNFVKSSCDLDK